MPRTFVSERPNYCILVSSGKEIFTSDGQRIVKEPAKDVTFPLPDSTGKSSITTDDPEVIKAIQRSHYYQIGKIKEDKNRSTFYIDENPIAKVFKCDLCGREFNKKIALSGHRRGCKGEVKENE